MHGGAGWRNDIAAVSAHLPGRARLHPQRVRHKSPTPCHYSTHRFDNLVLRALPVEDGDNRPRPVSGACFSRAAPTPLSNPRVVAVSADALRLLDLDPEEVGALCSMSEGRVIGVHPSTRRVEKHTRSSAIKTNPTNHVHATTGHQQTRGVCRVL